MGFEVHHGVRIAAWGLTRIKVRHGVRNTSWGEKYTMGWEMRQGEGIKEGVCVCYYTGRPTQLGRPLRLWRARPPSPRHCVGLPVLVCMLLQGKERESEEV